MSLKIGMPLVWGSREFVKNAIQSMGYNKCYIVVGDKKLELVFNEASKIIFNSNDKTETLSFIDYNIALGDLTLRKDKTNYIFKIENCKDVR